MRQATGDKLGDITALARQLKDAALLAGPQESDAVRVCGVIADELLAILTNCRSPDALLVLTPPASDAGVRANP
ncbi:hypothetical protein [Tersicoccus phoenicis]|nr:hypothetical protein [Tersicoccus phoenicis]